METLSTSLGYTQGITSISVLAAGGASPTNNFGSGAAATLLDVIAKRMKIPLDC